MKRSRIASLVALLLSLSVKAYSQGDNIDIKTTIEKKNNIDLSIGGNGLFASINYSRALMVKSNYFIQASTGIGIVPFVDGITLPIQSTFNLGKKNSFLELGIGGTYLSGKRNTSGNSEKINSYQLSPIIGWRKHFDSNLVFRAYANPLFHISGEYFIEDYPVVPYLGISLGYSF